MNDRTAPADVAGYVECQRNPYRGHMLLVRSVLAHTRPGDRIFEGGTSTGYLSAAFADAHRVVDGAELDPDAARAAARVCQRVIVGDIEGLDVAELSPPYQAFVFADTLEHLRDPPALLRRLWPILDDDGVLVVSIPNVANWAVRLGLLFGSFRYTDRGILDRTHLRFYTAKTAVEMLSEGGFRVTELVAAIPVPGVSSPRLSRVAHWIGNLRPSLFAYTFIITASKAKQPPIPGKDRTLSPWWRR